MIENNEMKKVKRARKRGKLRVSCSSASILQHPCEWMRKDVGVKARAMIVQDALMRLLE